MFWGYDFGVMVFGLNFFGVKFLWLGLWSRGLVVSILGLEFCS